MHKKHVNHGNADTTISSRMVLHLQFICEFNRSKGRTVTCIYHAYCTTKMYCTAADCGITDADCGITDATKWDFQADHGNGHTI